MKEIGNINYKFKYKSSLKEDFMTDKKDVHEHDHDHDHEEELDIITLSLEDGSEIECGIIGIFESEGKEYMALWEMEEDEVLLFNYEEKEDEFELTPIEDDEEFQSVCDVYYELMEEEDED